MFTRSIEGLPQLLRDEAQALGESMDRILPFRKPRLVERLLRAETFCSSVALISMEGEGILKRAWLERPLANVAERSPIELYTDTVIINPDPKDLGLVAVRSPNVPIIHTPGEVGGFGYLEGEPEDATLDRLSHIKSLLAEISLAGLHKNIRQTPRAQISGR